VPYFHFSVNRDLGSKIPVWKASGYNPVTYMALAPGVRLGPYEILSSLGAGGMGEVYRAQDSRLDRVTSRWAEEAR
jgi:serine/threonine protein kinase